jgi:hypothetical protein
MITHFTDSQVRNGQESISLQHIITLSYEINEKKLVCFMLFAIYSGTEHE